MFLTGAGLHSEATMEYYYHDGHIQQGPFTLEALRRQPLRQDTPVWHEGLKGWTMAIAIPELIDLFIDLSQPAAGSTPPPPGSAPPSLSHPGTQPAAPQTPLSPQSGPHPQPWHAHQQPPPQPFPPR